MKERKNVKAPPKEKLICGASGDIDGITYFIKIRSKDRLMKKSYYEPRSEKDRKRKISKRNLNQLVQKINQTQCDDKSKLEVTQVPLPNKDSNQTKINY
jgi:hypothetical protein